MLTDVPSPNRQRPGRIEKEELSTLHVAFERIGIRERVGANSEICRADEPADHFYKILSGLVRWYRSEDDGRRLIAAFYVAGDFFGLENTEQHRFSATAVVDTEILVVDYNMMRSLAEQDAGLARDLWTHMANEVRRMQSHLLLLKRSASERVATFLLEMSEHILLSDGLPMTRDDIADYLALRAETVSRILTRSRTHP